MGQKSNRNKTFHAIKRQYLDIFVLLGVLLLVSFGITKIHAKKTPNQGDTRRIRPKDSIEVAESLKHIMPLLASRSVEKIAEYLKPFPPHHVRAVLQKIIMNQGSLLERNDKLQLLFAVALNYKDEPKRQQAILNFMEQYKEGEPLLLVAVRNNYEHALPMILTWVAEKKDAYIQDAFDQALIDNDVQALTDLLTTIKLEKEQANGLLWNAIATNRDSGFVDLLVGHGADVNYKHASGRTPLIKATENNNPDTVAALLDADADFDLIVDDAVGSALQQAIAKGYTVIDMLLRDHGARE